MKIEPGFAKVSLLDSSGNVKNFTKLSIDFSPPSSYYSWEKGVTIQTPPGFYVSLESDLNGYYECMDSKIDDLGVFINYYNKNVKELMTYEYDQIIEYKTKNFKESEEII